MHLILSAISPFVLPNIIFVLKAIKNISAFSLTITYIHNVSKTIIRHLQYKHEISIL